MTFEDTPNGQKIIVPTSFQILSQAKFVEEVGVELVEGAIN
jgi:hypothetical protein